MVLPDDEGFDVEPEVELDDEVELEDVVAGSLAPLAGLEPFEPFSDGFGFEPLEPLFCALLSVR